MKEDTDEIRNMALHLVGRMRSGVDKEEYFQIAYLEGLEARERGADAYSAMRRKVSHKLTTSGSPVEVPISGENNKALAKMRRGEEPDTEAERRVTATIGQHTEVLPITVVTNDTPESLLIDKQLMDRISYCMVSHKVLSEREKDSIRCVFFGSFSQEVYMKKHGVERLSLWRDTNRAVEKLRKHLK